MSKLSKVIPFVALAACSFDPDNDGYVSSEDCAPHNAEIYPGAQELCDGIDNDCNGVVDDIGLLSAEAVEKLLNIDGEQEFIRVFSDKDGDGCFSNKSDGMICSSNYSTTSHYKIRKGEDCNDEDSSIYSDYYVSEYNSDGLWEHIKMKAPYDDPKNRDGIDNDCNGVIDGGIKQDVPEEISELWPESLPEGSWELLLAKQLDKYSLPSRMSWSPIDLRVFNGVNQDEREAFFDSVRTISNNDALFYIAYPWVSEHFLEQVSDDELPEYITDLACLETYLQTPNLIEEEAKHLAEDGPENPYRQVFPATVEQNIIAEMPTLYYEHKSCDRWLAVKAFRAVNVYKIATKERVLETIELLELDARTRLAKQ